MFCFDCSFSSLHWIVRKCVKVRRQRKPHQQLAIIWRYCIIHHIIIIIIIRYIHNCLLYVDHHVYHRPFMCDRPKSKRSYFCLTFFLNHFRNKTTFYGHSFQLITYQIWYFSCRYQMFATTLSALYGKLLVVMGIGELHNFSFVVFIYSLDWKWKHVIKMMCVCFFFSISNGRSHVHIHSAIILWGMFLFDWLRDNLIWNFFSVYVHKSNH